MKTIPFLPASVLALLLFIPPAPAQTPACPLGYDEGVYGKQPLAFVINQGQHACPVRFYAMSPQATVYFTPTEVVFHFAEKDMDPAEPKGLAGPELGQSRSDAGAGCRELVLRVSFPDANPNVIIEGQEELPGKVNIFKGKDASQWLTAIPTYRKLIYRNLWEGIDLVYYGMPGCGMKYDLVLRSGADPSRIRLMYSGCEQLAVTTFNGSSDFYVTKLNADGSGLAYSTFLGGSSLEQSVTIDVDAAGSAYLTGEKYSSNFPLTPGAPASGYSFLTVFNASGTDVLYSAYLGGSAGITVGRSIAVGANSCAYIAGYTISSNFPVTAGAYDTSWSGGYDAFVAKFETGPHVYRATVTHDGSRATIRWNALADTTYLVEWSEDMSAWTQVPVGAMSQWTDMATVGHWRKFYRVREAPPLPPDP